MANGNPFASVARGFSALAPVFAGAAGGPQFAVDTARFQTEKRQLEGQQAGFALFQQAMEQTGDPKLAFQQVFRHPDFGRFGSLELVKAMREAIEAGAGPDLGASGQKLAAAGIQPGTPEAREALFPEPRPTMLEQKIALYKGVLGFSDTAAVKHATGLIKVAQVTNPFTGQSYPIVIDETTGRWEEVGGSGLSGSAEELAALQEQGMRVEGEMRLSEAAPEAREAMERTEDLPVAGAVAQGTGSAAAIGRGLSNVLTGLGVHGAQNQLLLDAKAAISDINLLGSAYIRDEAGTARLAGVTELEAMRELLPKTGVWMSREENVTNLIRLRSRLLKDMGLYEEALAKPHSPDFRRAIEERLDTANRMLARIGTEQELLEAREFIQENPQNWAVIGEMLGVAGEDLPEATRRAAQALPKGPGMPQEDFNALLKRVRSGKTTDQDEAAVAKITDPAQIDALMEALEQAGAGNP